MYDTNECLVPPIGTSGPEGRIRTVIIPTIPATMEIIQSIALAFLVIVFLDSATSRPIPREHIWTGGKNDDCYYFDSSQYKW
ncbi:hypothetical protein GDO78_018340 [Eleutherodactylus coqui]|uniref:Uncharacterized protein n=1 Tax=Eleutherodactylus coqui TaxID=57060 RepID=A0A8J6B411_ELECQ|nr:hypothetical protein GDO78_018340 [Eleutherodactylus coqui]